MDSHPGSHSTRGTVEGICHGRSSNCGRTFSLLDHGREGFVSHAARYVILMVDRNGNGKPWSSVHNRHWRKWYARLDLSGSVVPPAMGSGHQQEHNPGTKPKPEQDVADLSRWVEIQPDRSPWDHSQSLSVAAGWVLPYWPSVSLTFSLMHPNAERKSVAPFFTSSPFFCRLCKRGFGFWGRSAVRRTVDATALSPCFVLIS